MRTRARSHPTLVVPDDRVVVLDVRPEPPLLVKCWCQRGYVKVDPAEIRAGRTATCGRARCEET